MPSHDCEGVKAKPLASRGAHHCMSCVPSFTRMPADAVRKDARSQHSRGAHHCMYPVFLMAPTRSEKTHTRSLSSVPPWLQATAYSIWRARDAVRKDTQGTTIWRQSPTHEVTNRDCHIPLTIHFIMIHTLFLMAKICLLQVLACIKRRDPCHVPPQTDPIIVHKGQALRSKQQHHDISKMS